MLMSAAGYRDSLRRYAPRVFVGGRQVESVADEPLFAPGLNAVGVTYGTALAPETAPLMTARQHTSGAVVNRMLHVSTSGGDLLAKLEAVRLVCREVGCAQRYLSHDAVNGIFQATKRTDDAHGMGYHQRFLAYLHRAQEEDLTLGVAMTDAKGDRSKRPGAQANPDVYVHVKERRPDGIVIRGTKAIVTAAPYVHEFLVMPCRTHTAEDRDFAVCCAVPVDAPGITIVARPAGRPGEAAAKYGQSVGVVLFDDVFVPHDRVFLDGEHEEGGYLTTNYATHHRHSCIGARAGFGDLLVGAGALMTEANGLDFDRHAHMRDQMVDLIKIVGALRLRCRGLRLWLAGPGGVDGTGRRLRQHRQAAAGDADLRYAPDRALRLRRADRGAAGAGRGPQPGNGGAAAGGRALHRGPDGLEGGRLALRHLAPRRRQPRGDEARDLAQLSRGGAGRSGRAAARPWRAG